MKTIEEIAFELYPDVSFKKDVASEDTFRTNEIRLLERAAFMAGYKDAMRKVKKKSSKTKSKQL